MATTTSTTVPGNVLTPNTSVPMAVVTIPEGVPDGGYGDGLDPFDEGDPNNQHVSPIEDQELIDAYLAFIRAEERYSGDPSPANEAELRATATESWVSYVVASESAHLSAGETFLVTRQSVWRPYRVQIAGDPSSLIVRDCIIGASGWVDSAGVPIDPAQDPSAPRKVGVQVRLVSGQDGFQVDELVLEAAACAG